jgi:hypothetical protein
LYIIKEERERGQTNKNKYDRLLKNKKTKTKKHHTWNNKNNNHHNNTHNNDDNNDDNDTDIKIHTTDKTDRQTMLQFQCTYRIMTFSVSASPVLPLVLSDSCSIAYINGKIPGNRPSNEI